MNMELISSFSAVEDYDVPSVTHYDPMVDSIVDGVNFDVMTPGDQIALFRTCRMRGIDISGHHKVQASISKFSSEFWMRSGVGVDDGFISSTTKTLMSVWSTFYRWCKAENHLPVLPAKEITVQKYLTYRSGCGVSKNTLGLDAWAISKLHNESGCIDPLSEPRTRDFLKNLKKRKVIVEQDITRQASGLRKDVVKGIIGEWSSETASLKNKRDLAIVVVGYFTLLRASELSRIRLSHISVDDEGGAIITIPISKTNHSGEPESVYINSKQMAHVFNYLNADGRSALDDSYLFGMVAPNGQKSVKSRNPLSVQTIRNVMGVAWEEFGREAGVKRKFTAHSTRVGGSQDMRLKGIPLLDIMHAGRWSGPAMVIRYTRDVAAKLSGAVSLQNDF